MRTPPAPAPDGAEPAPARLVIGAIVADRGSWAAAEERLAAAFGPFEPCLLAFPFDHTDYYRGEMGGDLLRVFRVLRAAVAPADLAELKHRTAGIEREFAAAGAPAPRRRVNLDPGLLSPAALVLASSKGYAHRVYLGRGVHAEVELIWRSGSYRPVAWTYPDYRRGATVAFLNGVRGRWMRELRGRAAPPRVPVPAGECC